MSGSTTRTLCEYIVDAAAEPLPDDVKVQASLHVLDTLAAGITGARLLPGTLAHRSGTALATSGRSQVWGSSDQLDPVTAAMVNGMSAHADETDDSHAPSLSHPGCAVIPAAVAMAEYHQTTGSSLLRAVTLGYDVGTRVVMAAGRDHFDLPRSGPSSHAFMGIFGSAAATAAITRQSARDVEHVMSYAAQLCSGVTTWLRDTDHVQKAFVFGGMPARNGVLSSLLVSSGLTGVPEVFDGDPNFLDAIGTNPQPHVLVDGLGERYEVMRTNIKKYAVGSPAQAAVQAVELLLELHRLTADQVQEVTITLPGDLCNVVNDREMPDINVQYLVAGTLVDGRFSFAMAHDRDRMGETEILRLRNATTLVPDDATSRTRSGTVTLTLRSGEAVTQHVPHVAGTSEDPMTTEQVCEKAADLLAPVIGQEPTKRLIGWVLSADTADDIRELTTLTSLQ